MIKILSSGYMKKKPIKNSVVVIVDVYIKQMNMK